VSYHDERSERRVQFDMNDPDDLKDDVENEEESAELDASDLESIAGGKLTHMNFT
jgi:hypothetical protein